VDPVFLDHGGPFGPYRQGLALDPGCHLDGTASIQRTITNDDLMGRWNECGAQSPLAFNEPSHGKIRLVPATGLVLNPRRHSTNCHLVDPQGVDAADWIAGIDTTVSTPSTRKSPI